MHISLNGKRRDLADRICVAALVREHLGREAPQGIAVALNGEVVRRMEWSSTVVGDGDAVEILTATAGG